MGLILNTSTIIRNLSIGPLSGGGEGGYTIPIETSGLQLWWDASQYGGSGTTVLDLSGNGRNGTIYGNPTFNNNGDSSYFSFNNTSPWSPSGQGSYILNSDTSSNYNIDSNLGPFSLSVWMEVPNRSVTGNTLLGFGTRDDGNSLFLQKIRSGYPYNGGANSWLGSFVGRTFGANSFTSNTSAGWKNLTLTVGILGTIQGQTNWNFLFYEDGVLVENPSSPNPYSNSLFSTFVIGHSLGFQDQLPNPEGGLAGNWANAAVYNRALSASEVLANYNALSSRF